VFRRLCITLGFILTCQIATAADTRWCTITSKRDTDTLVYPPIAKAAHLQGVVILRVNFSTTGSVSSVESISGPQMLVDSTSERLKAWQLHTNAIGDQPCQSLVVVKYRVLPESYDLQTESPSKEQPHPPAGIYQIWIDAYTIILTEDLPPTLTRKRHLWIF
jgi:hypothetical protein